MKLQLLSNQLQNQSLNEILKLEMRLQLLKMRLQLLSNLFAESKLNEQLKMELQQN